MVSGWYAAAKWAALAANPLPTRITLGGCLLGRVVRWTKYRRRFLMRVSMLLPLGGTGGSKGGLRLVGGLYRSCVFAVSSASISPRCPASDFDHRNRAPEGRRHLPQLV